MTPQMRTLLEGIRDTNILLFIFSIGGLLVSSVEIKLAVPSLVFCLLATLLQRYNITKVNARCAWVVITNQRAIGSWESNRQIVVREAGLVLRVVCQRRYECLCEWEEDGFVCRAFFPYRVLSPFVETSIV